MDRVGVRELRQNLSRYLERVKRGETLAVTERGREVARLSPSGPGDTPLARLVHERGATLPKGDLSALTPPGGTPAVGPPSEEVIDELRWER